MKINGLPVFDATAPVKLIVTPKDVAKGDTKDPAACAAAQSAIRLLHADEARVHLGRTYLRFGKRWTRYQTTEAVRAEIISFDRGGKFAPGEYHLSAPSPSQQEKRGKRQGTKVPDKPRKHKKSAHHHILLRASARTAQTGSGRGAIMNDEHAA